MLRSTPSDTQIREVAQQDLGLGTGATTDLEQLAAAPERQPIVHRLGEERGLALAGGPARPCV